MPTLVALAIAFTLPLFALPLAAYGQTYANVSSSQTVSDFSQNTRPIPGCVTLTANLFFGSRDASTGGQVSQLQSYLKTKGYYSYAVTGYYGSLTSSAVVRFQQAHGIAGTGYVGPLTRAAIRIDTYDGHTVSTPTVSHLSPSSGAIGTTVTITGSGFTSDNTVIFDYGVIPHISSSNGVSLTFVVPEALSPSCAYSNPACMLAIRMLQPGTYNVSVQNANGTSNVLTFTVTNGSTVASPKVSSITPSYGPTGTTFTIVGSGFTSDNNIKFDIGGTSHVTAGNNGTTLTFTVPSYIGYTCPYTTATCVVPMLAKQVVPGTYNIYVENAYGMSNTVTFTVTSGTSNSVPNIISLSPSSGGVGASVTIRGTGFNSNNTINFGAGTVPSVSSADGTTLTFTVPDSTLNYCPAGSLCGGRTQITPGNYFVYVQNSNGTSNSVSFTVTGSSASSPTISYLSPSSGATGSSVTVYGSGFSSSGNTVKFGSLVVDNLYSYNGTSITFSVPVYITYCPPNVTCIVGTTYVQPGNYDVSVQNANGSLSNSAVFTVTSNTSGSQTPVISSVSGPTNMSVYQSGTWSITARDTSYGSQLSYNVTWGDEGGYPYAMVAPSYYSSQQMSTFTHSYSQPGTYTITFTVTNNVGASSRATMTVTVR